jgi:branched-chain amino acid aminotransferase
LHPAAIGEIIHPTERRGDMAGQHPKFIWMNGQYVLWEDAKIHVTTEAVGFGSSVFEGLRAYWNDSDEQLYIFRLDDHMRRLAQSMKMMRMTPEHSVEEIGEVCSELLVKNGLREDVHLRPTVYFGVAKAFFAHRPGTVDVGAYVTASPRKSTLGTAKGIHACVSSWTRISDRDMPPRIKAAANYQNGRLANAQAVEDGYDSPILLNEMGKVAEFPGACLFLVRDGTVITPPVTGSILESITRVSLIQLFEEQMSVPVVEREVDRTELYIADEVFMCGSAMEVTPVFSVDKYQVGEGKVGPLTAQLQTEYDNAIRGKEPKYRDWLLPVYT